jgi:hypothetical protein
MLSWQSVIEMCVISFLGGFILTLLAEFGIIPKVEVIEFLIIAALVNCTYIALKSR